MSSLLDQIQESEDSPAFGPGDVVVHVRYGYRGVIVAFDLTCQASSEWYLSNSTHPGRCQPWYHVLVDQGHHTTYVAQENLEREPDPATVQHPLMAAFFEGFDDQRYVRNTLAWEAFWNNQG